MAEIRKLSEATKSLARKSGKLPKRPKKPKKGSSLTVLENYIVRHNNYVDKINKMAQKATKKATLSKRIFGS